MLYYKRIETGTIKWPNKPLLTEIEIRQFRWLFDGLKINQKALKKCGATRII
ncbi:MAG: IS66 family insertion sequence element accessory protein TnpB [Acholeplasmatales bacterium]|nr:IS66 family insertion sequence element accessory protein TnpB [Acholeplasmatales bacterium]